MTLLDRTNITARILLWLVICLSTSALAENKQGAQAKNLVLSTLPIASGSFVQRKYFRVLNHPIESQGVLYFDINIGLLWQTEQPLYSALLLKQHGLFTESATGVSQELKGASAISQVLLNIMSGDREKLTQNFTISNSAVEHCLSLRPILSQLAKVIDNVQLCQVNSSEINHIVLHEHNGNRTEIELQLTPLAVLPEAVRARLQ